jgi:hypothetical protein
MAVKSCKTLPTVIMIVNYDRKFFIVQATGLMFYAHNLRGFVIGLGFCPWQAFTA